MKLAFDGMTSIVEIPDSPELFKALEAAAADWPFRIVHSEAPPVARISGTGTELLVHFPDEDPVPASPVAAACSLMVSLAEAFVAENPDQLCLHGGAAVLGDQLVVFPGRSRSGKSTLMARLAASGRTIFCDDILPLDADGNGVALGVAPRLRMPLPPAASVQFREFVAQHTGAADHRYLYLALPARQLARRGTTAAPAAIVLLDRQPTGKASLHRAPERLSLKLLASQNVLAATDTGPILQQMRAIARHVPCLVLAYCDLEDAIALLDRTFASGPLPELPPLPDEAGATLRLLAPEVRPEPGVGSAPSGTDLPYRRHAGIVLHRVDGEAFLAGPTSSILHLNAVGAGIWNLLAEPICPREAAAALAVAFPDVDPSTLAQDVAQLFAELQDAGAIEPAG